MFGQNLRASLGGLVGKAGKVFGLPEFGISEKIQGRAPAQPRAQVMGAKAPVIPQGISSGYNPSGRSGGGTYGSTLQSTATFAPATSGEAVSTGDSGGYDQDYLNQIRSQFDTVRGGYETAINSYDSDYNLGKTNTEAAIARAKDTLGTQNAEDERLYGENLKSLLQTDRELRQRRQGVFSTLGSLDSSAYRDDVTQADQSLLDNQQKINSAKTNAYNERQKQYSAYEQDATSKLSSYQNEITRAKAALQQAIAESNINEASSILSYIDQMNQRSQQLADSQTAMKMQLAQLAAQGVDVVGNLSKLNTVDFSNQFGAGLKNQLASAQARYSLPTPAFGSGYINPKTGRPYSDEERRLAGI